MVVIETGVPISAGEKEEERIQQTKKSLKQESTSSSSTSAADESRHGGEVFNSNKAPGYASDGFETASEADLNEDDVVVEEQKQEQKVEDGNTKTENGTTDAVEMEKEREMELNEKALAEANSAKLEGNNLFKDGLYEEALLKYDIALQATQNTPSSSELCSVCHANRAACFSRLEKFEDAIKECTKALELNPNYIKVLLRRAEAHEKLERFEEAIADMTKVLEVDPSNDQARRSIVRLKPLADEKREKMKDEMIGKLKEMGNSILGRFGMSVDNFKAVKDPNTGSYSVSFQR